MKPKHTKVESIEHLKEILKDTACDPKDFILMLSGGIKSSKTIGYDGDIFYIFNLIDDSEQDLTEEEIMDDEYTNIGKGIRLGNFYLEDFSDET